MTNADAPFRLDGKIALVTGGTRGIGAAIAEEFADAGARVLLTGRQQADADDVAARIGRGATGFAYDSNIEGAAEKLAQDVTDKVGVLDVLVNNAAILKPHFLSRVSRSELDELLSVNVKSPFFLSNGVHPLLKASGKGAIVTITAAGGHRPMPGIGAYCGSKAALINFTIAMAKEWAKDGIRVNALTPGSVATDAILPKDPAKREAFVAEMASQNLFKRLADPREIARAARFLASDAASYMTGSVMTVDAGFLA